MIRFLLFFGLLLSNIQAAWFSSQSFHLSNGMQVVVVYNPKAPLVSHNLWVKAGSMNDPLGKSGIAHFLEHLFLKGGGGVPIEAFDKELERMGADHNAFTSWDYTCYYQNIPNIYLERVMMIMAARLKNLELNDKIVTSERHVILEERYMRLDNKPERLANEAMMRALFWHHPYGTSMIGWRHEMESLSMKDVLSFHHTWYAPNNCVLVLAGNITFSDAQRLAEKYYGPLAKRTVPARNPLIEPPHHKIRTQLFLKHHRIGMKNGVLGLHLPTHAQPSIRTQIGYDILTYILNDEPLGYLYQEFVIKRKMATQIGFSCLAPSYSQGFAMIQVHPQNQVATKDCLKQIRLYLKKLHIDPERVKEAKKRMLIADELKKDSIFSGTNIGTYAALNFSLQDVEQWPDLLNNITVEEIQKALKDILQDRAYVELLLTPAQKNQGAGQGTSALKLPMTSLGH